MAKEIERKFLLDKAIPWELEQQKLIKQGYVFSDKGKQLRIRIIHDQAFMCLKFTKDRIRDEYEYEVPLIDGLEIYHKCKNKLEKIRNTIRPISKPYTVDVDTYPNGLIVAEVEFKTEEDCNNFEPFEWFGEEITGNKKYSNITLSKQKLSF
jgi:CYTH domain-containing protein